MSRCMQHSYSKSLHFLAFKSKQQTISKYLRIWWVNIMNGNSSFNASKGKACWFVHFVFENSHTAMLNKRDSILIRYFHIWQLQLSIDPIRNKKPMLALQVVLNLQQFI